MPKRSLAVWLCMLFAMPMALLSQGTALPSAHANVVPYDDADAAQKLTYRESAYFLELTGSWKQRQTDSSLLYSRQIDVGKVWKEYSIRLFVRGGRAVRVYVNGKEVGYADDSRQWNEFVLDRALKYGRPNTLAIETLKHSAGALLEDSAIAVGLNGEPYIVFKNDPNISDIDVSADYDSKLGEGTLSLGVSVFCGKKKGKYYIDAELVDPKGRRHDRMGRWVVFDGRTEEHAEITRSWSDVSPWTAEDPQLYSVVVRLLNEKMEELEIVGSKLGFRRVAIEDGVLQVNGLPVAIKGITYGREHTEGYASREAISRDLKAMKGMNINAVRTSHYSPMDPYFYELCDRIGLYVVCDANLNPLSTQHRAVATERDMIPLFERRVENMYGSYKNHASIIAWSLGDTRDNGVCMASAYRRLKGLEKHRPVIFSGAAFGESTDVIGLRLPDSTELRQIAEKQGDRPIILMSAVDSRGLGDLPSLWSIVESRYRLQGGFVDVWPLGSTSRQDLQYLFRPFNVSVSKLTPDEGTFLVSNRNLHTSLSNYRLEYTIYTSLRPNVVAGDLPIAAEPGQSDKVSLRIPQLDLMKGEELFIRFTLVRRSGGEAGTMVLPLQQSGRRRSAQAAIQPLAPEQRSVRLPELVFEGHPDWQAELVDSIMATPDNGTYCEARMFRYTAPGGAVVCDVRAVATVYSPGDMVTDYSVMPTGNIRGRLIPVVRIASHADTLRWFGAHRHTLIPGSAQPGTYSAPLTAPLTRHQVRWCALTGGGQSTYAAFADQQCSISWNDTVLSLSPDNARSFSLHLKQLLSENPSDVYALTYPQNQLTIPSPPAITASQPRFSRPIAITLSSGIAGAEIRYTTDGSEPSPQSELYKKPFTIAATTVVKARVYAKGLPPSFTATRKFNYDHIIATTFNRRPNTPYNVGTDTLLFDGMRGSIDDLTRGWLGFSGTPPTITVCLADTIVAESLRLRFAHNPATWAFAPESVSVMTSIDSANHTDTLTIAAPFDPSLAERQGATVVEFSIPLPSTPVGYLRIAPSAIPAIPQWHRAKGLKPWLLMDEIEIIER